MPVSGPPLVTCPDCKGAKYEDVVCKRCHEISGAQPLLTREQAVDVYQLLVEELDAEPDQHDGCANAFVRGEPLFQFVAWYREAGSEVLTLAALESGRVGLAYRGRLEEGQAAQVAQAERLIAAYLEGRTRSRPFVLLRPSVLAEKLGC